MAYFRTVGASAASSWKIFQLQWARTKEQWKDSASEEFEKKILQDFEPAVREITSQLDWLDQLVEQARHEIK